ncbi:alpha/beta hydrolase-fold protein [Ekhidna sp.]|uniref:alpha/beta hydrolase-fold protein n=1 Tax=Ekhidna sp. TaxID=2608089 RepID=UPI0032971475
MKKHLSKTYLVGSILLASFACKKERAEPMAQTDVISSFSELIAIVDESDSSMQYGLVEDFIDSIDFPFIENDSTVYFLYQGDANSVSVAGDFTGWSPSGRGFVRLRDTQLWYRTESFEADARLDYKLVINGSNWILDPKNPNQIGGGFGANSELAMPEYVQPGEIQARETEEKGTTTSVQLSSINTNKTYEAFIYLPHGYDETKSYPVVYFQDGADYLNLAYAANVIDNLISDGSIQSLIAVFVVPNNRNVEYAFEDRFDYSEFFVSELVLYIDSNYNTIAEPSGRAVIGDSYGGNISAIIAFQNPDVFGNCGIHSGAFQPNNFHTNAIVMDDVKKDIKIASIWGTYEGSSLPPNMRSVRDYLIENDYEIYWKELHEGHSWGLWRATIDDMLIFFFPK